MSINYIQFHIGDFLSGVMHMDGVEVGAYTMLLMAHYQAGEQGIPDDDKKLRQICKINTRAWASVKKTVLEKFYLENGYWKHERVIEEIEKIRSKAGPGRPKAADEKQLEETLIDNQKTFSVDTKKNKPLKNNDSQKTNQEPRTSININNPPIAPPTENYYSFPFSGAGFEGDVIQLDGPAFNLWFQRYSFDGNESKFRDIIASRDQWYATQPPRVYQQWLPQTTKWLAKKIHGSGAKRLGDFTHRPN